MHKLSLGIIAVVLSISCSQRDLSTPSSRLIGHWMRTYEISQEVIEQTKKEIREIHEEIGIPLDSSISEMKPGMQEIHHYYEKPIPETQTGNMITIDEYGTKRNSQYRIVSERITGEQANLHILAPGFLPEQIEYSVTKDGQFLIINDNSVFSDIFPATDTFQYVDAKTEP